MTIKQTQSFDANNNNYEDNNGSTNSKGHLFANNKPTKANSFNGANSPLDGQQQQQQQQKPIMCDRNNDGRCRADVSGSMLNGVGEGAQAKYRTVFASEAGADAHNATQLTTKTISDWHLLDVDGHSVAASSTSSSSNELDTIHELPVGLEELRRRRKLIAMRDKTISHSNNHKMTQSNGEQSGQVEANGKHQRQVNQEESLSPALIHACTLLYALMPLASCLAFFTLLGLLFTSYWFITVCYYSYLFLDRNTCNRGGRRIDAVYKSKFWTYLAAHFPIQLKHSAQFQLDPNENYILNYHPHGIAAFGCVTAFATNGLNFTKLFPNIKSHFMVHETSFLVPVMRETFSLRGDCSVNSNSFDYILSKKWKQPTECRKQEAGHLLALCGGGLAEADLSDAKTLKIVVASRKGFVKKALIHGANLIPCIAFGENSIFTKVNLKPKSLLHRLESRFYSLFKFKHPIYYGSSAFGFKTLRGVMPYKRPISVVMGDPIKVDRVEEPSQEQIDHLHAKYMEALHSMYATNKSLCTKYDTRMELV